MPDKVQSEPPHIVCAQCVGQDLVSHGSRDRGCRARRRGRLVRSDDILVVGCTGAACNDGLGRAEVFSGARCAGTVLQRKRKERAARERVQLWRCQWYCRACRELARSTMIARSARVKVALIASCALALRLVTMGDTL